MNRGKKIEGYASHPGSIWIDANRATLPKDEWVAADENGLVDHDVTIGILYKKLRDRNIGLASVTIAFIETSAL